MQREHSSEKDFALCEGRPGLSDHAEGSGCPVGTTAKPLAPRSGKLNECVSGSETHEDSAEPQGPSDTHPSESILKFVPTIKVQMSIFLSCLNNNGGRAAA